MSNSRKIKQLEIQNDDENVKDNRILSNTFDFNIINTKFVFILIFFSKYINFVYHM